MEGHTAPEHQAPHPDQPVPAAWEAAGIPSANSFREDLEQHLVHGWVYSSPTAFGLARLVHSSWPEDALRDCRCHALREEADMWYFTRVAGDAAEVLSRLPFPMPQVGYYREKKHRTVTIPYDRFCSFLLPSHPECGFHAIERWRQGQEVAPSPASGAAGASPCQ